jgi:hypothetical protein
MYTCQHYLSIGFSVRFQARVLGQWRALVRRAAVSKGKQPTCVGVRHEVRFAGPVEDCPSGCSRCCRP